MTRVSDHSQRFLASLLLATLLFVGLFSLTVFPADAASAPNILNYQGRLLNANGVPISTTTASISFAIYSAVSGGTCVWSNNSGTCASIVARTVSLTDGLFSENLGDTAAGTPYAAIPDAVFADNAALYLEVIVEGETLSPRKQLVAAPYSMNSDTIDGFNSTQVGATSAAALVLDSAGNLQLTGNPSGPAVSNGSLYINPSSLNAADDDIIFGIAIDGASIFSVNGTGLTTVGSDINIAGAELLAGTLYLNSGYLSSTGNNLNLLDESGTKTIDIGGVTTSATNSINIATEGTLADTIIIGNSNASSLLTLTGGNDWSISSAGLFTTASNANINGGDINSTAAINITSTGGDIKLSPSGSGLAYISAGDNFAVGNGTTTAAFSVTETTNVIRIGDGTSDANDPTINFYSSNASTTGALSYLDADTFAFTGGNFNVTSINTTSGSAQLFTDSTVTTGTGLNVVLNGLTGGVGTAITRAGGGADFTGKLFYVSQANTSATSTGDVVVIENLSNAQTPGSTSTGLYLVQNAVSNETDAFGGTTRGSQALFIDITEAGSTDDAVLIRAGGQLVFDIQSNGSVLSDGSYSSTGADYAEYFATNDAEISNSLIACQDTNVNNAVQRCLPGTSDIVGIVSPTPGFIGNMPSQGQAASTAIVGLNGQIDTLVDDSGGAINIGDPITVSSITTGYGAKATSTGRIVGYALEPLAPTSSTGTIRVLVQPQWFGGLATVPEVSDAPITPAEVIAANPVVTASNTISGLTNPSLLDVDGSLNMNGGRILSVSSLQGFGDNWHLAENGDFTTHGQYIGLVNGYSGTPVETYGTMSRQHQIQLSGTSILQNGIARILFADVDPQFADIISHTSPYRVIATPSGLTGQIYVSERDLTGFTIRDVDNSGGVQVDWLVMAYNKDFDPSAAANAVTDSVQPVIGQAPVDTMPSIGSSDDVPAPTAETSDLPVVVSEEQVLPSDSTAETVIAAEPATASEQTPVESSPTSSAPVSTPDSAPASEPAADVGPTF